MMRKVFTFGMLVLLAAMLLATGVAAKPLDKASPLATGPNPVEDTEESESNHPLVVDKGYEEGKGAYVYMNPKGPVFHTWWMFEEGSGAYETFGDSLHTVCLESEKAPQSWDISEEYVIDWTYEGTDYICKQQVEETAESDEGLLESGGWMKIMSMEKISVEGTEVGVVNSEGGLNLIVLLGNEFNKYKACVETGGQPPFCQAWESTKAGILGEAYNQGLLEEGDSIEMLLPPHTR